MTTASMAWIGKVIIGAPLGALLLIVIDRIYRHHAREIFIKRCVAISQSASMIAALLCTVWVFWTGKTVEVASIGMVHLSSQDMVYSLRIDRLSSFFVVMNCLLGGIVGLFASRYLHRDSGYFRFFVLYHLFMFGIHSIFQGGGLPTVYIGWEVIGITSALLISFFAFRKQTVANSLRAFWAYRITDSGILLATLFAMHYHIESFNAVSASVASTGIVCGCLFSAVGKSAQFPFGRWLPKAMEGPTPSSAIFYGGLSVHAGVYLMLRAAVVYGLPLSVSVLMVLIGIASTWYATVVGRIQSDAKNALAYAAMAQVGLMFVEVGFGLHALAVFHFVSHAMLRTYQLLNAASVMHDRYAFEHVLGRDTDSSVDRTSERERSTYAYAFWESIDGTFGRLSLLSASDAVSRSVRRFEELMGDVILFVARRLMFLIRHPLRGVFVLLRRPRREGRNPT